MCPILIYTFVFSLVLHLSSIHSIVFFYIDLLLSLSLSFLLSDSSSFVECEETDSPQYLSAVPSMRQPLPPRQNRYTLFHINYSYNYRTPRTYHKAYWPFGVYLFLLLILYINLTRISVFICCFIAKKE